MPLRLPTIKVPRPTAFRWPWIALALVVTLVAVLGFRLATRDARVPPASQDPAVDVRAAALGSVEQTTRVSGALSPNVSLRLGSKVAGTVDEVLVELGQEVEKGDLLVRLDATDIRPAVLQAEAALEAARAQMDMVERGARPEEIAQLEAMVESAQAAADMAAATLERMEVLYQEGAISRAELEGAQTQSTAASAQLSQAQLQLDLAVSGADEPTKAAARAQLKGAEAAYEQALAHLESTKLRAPARGLIAYVGATAGELVSPGIPLVSLVDIDTLYLDTGVSESVVIWLLVGSTVEVRVQSAAKEVEGTISHVAPAADPQTRLFQVRIRIGNDGRSLRPGMMAETDLTRTRVEGVVVVPRVALAGRGDTRHVFVVDDGVALRREITIGLEGPDLAEVVHGLSPGELVVVSGTGFLEDGSPVRVRTGEGP